MFAFHPVNRFANLSVNGSHDIGNSMMYSSLSDSLLSTVVVPKNDALD